MVEEIAFLSYRNYHYILYTIDSRKIHKEPLKQKDFRKSLCYGLLSENKKFQNFNENKITIKTKLMHLIEIIPGKKQRQCNFNECIKRPITQCATCEKAVCIEHFKDYHENL